jgi:hypothetical protein
MQSFFSRNKNKFPQVGLAIALGVVFLMEDVALMFFASQNIQQSNSSLLLYAISICTILTLWVHYDSRSSVISMGMDQTMYIFFGWPIMFPVYAFRSRGFRRGGLLLMSFLGITIVAFIAAFIITIAMNIGVAVFSTGQ